MGNWLQKLGRGTFNHAKLTLALVIIFIAAMIGVGVTTGGKFAGTSLSLSGTESQKAMTILKKEFPNANTDGGQLNIVFHSQNGDKLTKETKASAINDVLQKIALEKGVATVASPERLQNFDSQQTTGYATIIFKKKAAEVTTKQIDQIKKDIQATKDAGIQTELSGTVTISPLDQGEVAEVFGILIAFTVLAITFASLLVAGLPIVTSLIGLVVSVMLIMVMAKFMDVSSVSLSLVGMMGLAVGIDYALFIISRFRQELAAGSDRQLALEKAMGTAGVAVVFAGATVIVAMAAMMTLGISFLGVMGMAAAIGVAMAVIMSLTFVPAILALLGDRVTGLKPNRWLQNFGALRVIGGWGRIITAHKIVLLIVSIAVLITAALPALQMNLGLPTDYAKSTKLTERRAYDLMVDAYGVGSQATLVVLAQTNDEKAAQQVQTKLTDMADVDSVSSAQASQKKDYYLLSVTPKSDANAAATKNLVKHIRALSHSNTFPKLYVTGQTAINIEIANTIQAALPKFAVIIVTFAFLLLMVVFRSLLIPLVAVAGFALSISATLGMITWIIQDGHLISLLGIPTKGAVLNFLPVLVIGIMFGLAMDYEVFLVSRIYENYQVHGDTKRAVQEGLKQNGPAIMAAILIMISVFSGFIFASDATVKSMGLALAAGVIFDALFVRMILVPATLSLFGRSNWYLPKWLDRILPHVHID